MRRKWPRNISMVLLAIVVATWCLWAGAILLENEFVRVVEASESDPQSSGWCQIELATDNETGSVGGAVLWQEGHLTKTHGLDYGDGDSVGWDGVEGAFPFTHVYDPDTGPYELVVTIQGADGQAVCSETLFEKIAQLLHLYLPVVMRGFVATPPPPPPPPGTPEVYELGWDTDWDKNPGYGDPTDVLTDTATHETFADTPDGVLPPANGWKALTGVSTTLEIPAGSFAIIATGEINLDGEALGLAYEDENSYIVVLKGYNPTQWAVTRTVVLSGYVGGVYNVTSAGSYFDLSYALAQVSNVANAPNCTDGCLNATILALDLGSNTYRAWDVEPSAPRVWIRQ